MRRMGICKKCGQYKLVQDHHAHGYSEEHKDDVVPYCNSCDQKAHAKAKREGKCILTHEEIMRKSVNSYGRRSRKVFTLSRDTLIPYVQLVEELFININTGSIHVCSFFSGNHKKKLKLIDEVV